jgi:hypothetical protein
MVGLILVRRPQNEELTFHQHSIGGCVISTTIHSTQKQKRHIKKVKTAWLYSFWIGKAMNFSYSDWDRRKYTALFLSSAMRSSTLSCAKVLQCSKRPASKSATNWQSRVMNLRVTNIPRKIGHGVYTHIFGKFNSIPFNICMELIGLDPNHQESAHESSNISGSLQGSKTAHGPKDMIQESDENGPV